MDFLFDNITIFAIILYALIVFVSKLFTNEKADGQRYDFDNAEKSAKGNASGKPAKTSAPPASAWEADVVMDMEQHIKEAKSQLQKPQRTAPALRSKKPPVPDVPEIPLRNFPKMRVPPENPDFDGAALSRIVLGKSDLRRAVVLSEIIGKPLSLRR